MFPKLEKCTDLLLKVVSQPWLGIEVIWKLLKLLMTEFCSLISLKTVTALALEVGMGWRLFVL